ncbi:hypothetical protein V6N13_122310 [Hibiscus sabdariffa]
MKTQSFHAANLDHLETSTRDRTSTNASRCYLNFQIKIQRNLGERTKKLMKINRRKSFCRLFRKGRIPSGQSYHKLVKIEL